jgi:hypothetical protein
MEHNEGWNGIRRKGRKEKRGQCLNYPRILTYAPKSQIAIDKFKKGQIKFFKISFINMVIYFDINVVGWTHDHKWTLYSLHQTWIRWNCVCGILRIVYNFLKLSIDKIRFGAMSKWCIWGLRWFLNVKAS